MPNIEPRTDNSLKIFSSYIAIERLQAAVDNWDDQALLYSLTRENENQKYAGLSIIWAFAMTRGAGMVQRWHVELPWRLRHTAEHPDGFFPDRAYRRLERHLSYRDQSMLRGFLEESVRMGRLEAPLWAIWEFAMAQARESSRQWREYLDWVRRREVAKDNTQANA